MNKKKYIDFFVYSFLTIICVLHSNCYYLFSQNAPSKIEIIKKKGTFDVAVYNKEVPPFLMHDSKGKFIGFDVDIAKDIARRLQVEVKFHKDAKTYNEIIAQVEKGSVDAGISFLSNTLHQAQKISFTDNYLTVNQTLIINRKIKAKHKVNNVFTWLNQREMTMGVLEGSSYIEYARDSFPNISLMLFKNYNSLYKAVNDEKIIAALIDDISIKNWLNINPETALNLQTITMNDKHDPISIAVNWRDTHFLLWLNSYLKQIKIDGTMKLLTEKYFTKDFSNIK